MSITLQNANHYREIATTMNSYRYNEARQSFIKDSIETVFDNSSCFNAMNLETSDINQNAINNSIFHVIAFASALGQTHITLSWNHNHFGLGWKVFQSSAFPTLRRELVSKGFVVKQIVTEGFVSNDPTDPIQEEFTLYELEIHW